MDRPRLTCLQCRHSLDGLVADERGAFSCPECGAKRRVVVRASLADQQIAAARAARTRISLSILEVRILQSILLVVALVASAFAASFSSVIGAQRIMPALIGVCVFVVAASAIHGVGRVVLRRSRLVNSHDRCSACGYDMRGSDMAGTGTKCPECGVEWKRLL